MATRSPTSGSHASRADAWRWARLHLAEAQKSGAGVPAYTRWVNRRAGGALAALAYAARLTPDGVTVLSAVSSIAGMTLLVVCPAVPAAGIATAAFLALGYALDSADGQLARLQQRSGRRGEWTDHVVDAFRSPALHVFTAVAIMVHRPDYAWLALVALAYSLVTSGQFLSQILAEAFARAEGARTSRGGDLRSWILLPVDSGTLCWMFVLWGYPMPFAVAYAAMAMIAVVHATISITHRRRDLDQVDAMVRAYGGE